MQAVDLQRGGKIVTGTIIDKQYDKTLLKRDNEFGVSCFTAQGE